MLIVLSLLARCLSDPPENLCHGGETSPALSDLPFLCYAVEYHSP